MESEPNSCTQDEKNLIKRIRHFGVNPNDVTEKILSELVSTETRQSKYYTAYEHNLVYFKKINLKVIKRELYLLVVQYIKRN